MSAERIGLVPITLEDLDEAGGTFREVEKRARFYDLARGLVEAGYELEGCVLLLATWNTSRFRVAGSNFDVDALEKLLLELRDDFAVLSRYTIQNIDLSKHGDRIKNIFDKLASLLGVEYTGASKLMHLKCPALFVMWDEYIRGCKSKWKYKSLPCVTAKKWRVKEYASSGDGYLSFLSDVQEHFRLLRYPVGPKTLAKAIDEFHYVSVTLMIQLIDAKIEERKKAAKAAPSSAPLGISVPAAAGT